MKRDGQDPGDRDQREAKQGRSKVGVEEAGQKRRNFKHDADHEECDRGPLKELTEQAGRNGTQPALVLALSSGGAVAMVAAFWFLTRVATWLQTKPASAAEGPTAVSKELATPATFV